MAAPDAKGLPADFGPVEETDEGNIDLAKAKGVRWVAKLGTEAYGNPTVAGGRVFVGTNNSTPRDPDFADDAGVLMCFDASSGKFLWQHVVPKLESGQVSDYPDVGLCSSPAVDGDRVYAVTNRCEVICLDTSGKPVWRFDMRDELGVFPNQMTSSSVLVLGDRLYATTSNARNWSGLRIPAPDAPALICLDKNTGKLLGQEKSGICQRMFLSHWSSPAAGDVGERKRVFFGADDGWCYAFDPEPVDGILKEIWRYDCNPASYREKDGRKLEFGQPEGPSGIIATPVFHAGRVYLAIGQEPQKPKGPGCLNCIDAATGRKVWTFEGIGRSLSTVAVADGLLYAADFDGFVYCLDAATGKQIWKHDAQDEIWGSPMVADDKVYIGTRSELWILAAAREIKVLGKVPLDTAIFSTPVTANGALFVATGKHLYAIGAR